MPSELKNRRRAPSPAPFLASPVRLSSYPNTPDAKVIPDMAQDPFSTVVPFEVPGSIREFAEKGVSQARETYDFQVHAIGEAVVVGFLNRVTVNVSGKPVERLFNETWVFVRVGGTLKLLRAHYSIVPVERDRS